MSLLPAAMCCWSVRPAVNTTQQSCCPCSKPWASRGRNLQHCINADHRDGQMGAWSRTVTLSGAIYSESFFLSVSEDKQLRCTRAEENSPVVTMFLISYLNTQQSSTAVACI